MHSSHAHIAHSLYTLILNRSVDTDRDVCNEKPTKEELVSQTQETTSTHLANTAVIHTSMGDIHSFLRSTYWIWYNNKLNTPLENLEILLLL